MRSLLLIAAGGLALTGCKPTAEDIEFMLGSQGVPAPAAQCIGQGLEPLDEEQWMTLAALAGDFMKTEDQLKDMTLAEISGKLQTLDDPQLMGTLVRTSLGCMVMHGGLGLQGERAPDAMVLPPLPGPDVH